MNYFYGHKLLYNDSYLIKNEGKRLISQKLYITNLLKYKGLLINIAYLKK